MEIFHQVMEVGREIAALALELFKATIAFYGVMIAKDEWEKRRKK